MTFLHLLFLKPLNMRIIQVIFFIKNILVFSDCRKDNITAHINIHLSVISFLLCISVKISGPSWAELTNGPVSYFIYEEPPGALSPTCPGVDPLVSMCERLFGKSGSFRGEGWFPWDALAKWGITYRCQCWAAIYPHTHRFRIWKPIYDEKTHASEKCCNLHDTGTFLRRFSHAPNCFITNLTEIPFKIQHFLFRTDQLHSINPVTSPDRKCWLFIAYNDAYASIF